MRGAVRTLVVRCSDWPVVAAGCSPADPVAVVHANRVVATSPAARAEGVARHQRRREAQGRCPALVVVEHDLARDARAFEPVVAALDALTPRVELTRPGPGGLPHPRSVAVLRGRRHAGGTGPRRGGRGGGRAVRRSGGRAGRGGRRALRRRAGGPLRRVPGPTVARRRPGGTPAFLAELPLAALERPDLVDVLGRLGLRRLGDLAALPGPDVLARFGTDGHSRLAPGRRPRRAAARPPSRPRPTSRVSAELDPPADTVAPAAFLARGMAEELHRRLWARGSACTRVVIGAETEHGERLERVWRAEGALTAAAMADRLRWQLDGWLQGSARHRPTAGITRLWLVPDEVVPAGGRQLGFWGTDVATADRAARAVARVQGLLGPGVGRRARVARRPRPGRAGGAGRRGGRRPHRRAARGPPRSRVAGPWPGRLPAPSPARVPTAPPAAELVDAGGSSLRVSGRGEVSAAPARLSVAGGPWQEVVAWAGPWPLEERWWDPASARRRARFQVVTDAGTAWLVVLEAGAWRAEAAYD